METNTITITLTDASLDNLMEQIINYKLITETKERDFKEKLERDKITANKEKFNTAMKTMNKNGALDNLLAQVVNKFLGGYHQPEIRRDGEIEKQIEEEMRVSPLYTSCNCLKLSLNQDEEENPDNSIKEFIKDTLNEETYSDLMDLLNSENEESAKTNLIVLQDIMSFEDLLKIQSRLTNGQRKIIEYIVNYKG